MIGIAEDIYDDLVRFTQQLIRIVSYTGKEGELAELLLSALKEIGVGEAFIDGIGNVVGVIRGEGSGPNILMNGHLDIVPPGNIENWHGFDPFGAEIDEHGNIHGRGAADLKGGLSVQLFAMKLMKLLIDKGRSLSGNLIFSAVVHEEAAEMFGMEYLCKETLPKKNLPINLVLLCEPTNLDVVLGQRGKVEVVVKTFGRTAHSSTPHLGINALAKMIPVLENVFNVRQESHKSHPLLGESSVTVTNLICKPGTLSIIPDECEISIDRRYMPDDSIEALLDGFRKLFETIKMNDPDFKATVDVRKNVETSYTGYSKEVLKYHPPWITDETSPFVRKIISGLKKVNQNPKIRYWKFGTDGSLTAGLMGIPTIGYSAMEEGLAHTPEEMVNCEKMKSSLEGYFSILCELYDIQIIK